MRARVSLSVSAVLALSALACDPLVAVHARITVPAGALAAYSGPYPAQVVVTDDHDTHEIGAPPHAYRVGVVCEKTDAPLVFEYGRGGIGCAEETHLVAYLAPFDLSAGVPTCGPSAQPAHLVVTPAPLRPSGSGVVFAGKKVECGNSSASADITLAP